MKIIDFSPEMYADVHRLWQITGIGLGNSDSLEQITNVFQRNPRTFLVGIIDHEIVAVVMGGSDARRGYVHHLAVHPRYQRQGFGEQIMDELIHRFEELKIQKIHLFIDKSNEGVVSFYQKMGWHVRDDLIMMSFIPNTSKLK